MEPVAPQPTRNDEVCRHLDVRAEHGVGCSTSFEIDVPPEIVWSVVVDVERWPEWTSTINSVSLLDRGPLCLGTCAVVRRSRCAPSIWQVTALDSSRRIAWQTGIPGAWISASVLLESVVDSTRVTLGVHYSGFLGTLIGRTMSAENGRRLAIDAGGLKQQSERLRRQALAGVGLAGCGVR